MNSPLARRIVWNVIPAVAVVTAVGVTLLAEDGLLGRHDLEQRLSATEAKVETLNVRNRQLRAEIWSLQHDPVAIRRAAAEELLVAEPGSTIYRFEAPR